MDFPAVSVHCCGIGCLGGVVDPTLVIFLLTYLVIAIGYLPGFRIDRTGAALLGAIAMIVSGAISSDGAWASVDFGTLSLLFGLMIVSALSSQAPPP